MALTIYRFGVNNMARRSTDGKKVNIASRMQYINIPQSSQNGASDDQELRVMSDARYLRQSASLIGEALQKGFDVLQLANGDIVTTGTKTVVYTYTWDEEKGKLVRAKAKSPKKGEGLPSIDEEHDDAEFESI